MIEYKLLFISFTKFEVMWTGFEAQQSYKITKILNIKGRNCRRFIKRTFSQTFRNRDIGCTKYTSFIVFLFVLLFRIG